MRNILLVSATKLEHHDDEINGYPIHIIGVGKVAAATNTLKLINQYKPEVVINFGSCGNLKGYDVGQILEIGEVYDDFYGCVVPEHEPISVLPRGRASQYKLFTTDTFYDKDAVYSNHYTDMIRKCDVVDMEGYSIAKVCLSENISVSLYKWVSDNGDSSSWLANASKGYNNFKKVFNERFN